MTTRHALFAVALAGFVPGATAFAADAAQPAPAKAPAPAPAVTDVWVAVKTHCDIGYTDTVAAILKKYREPMMDDALAFFERDKSNPPGQRFAWTLAGWPLRYVMGPEQDPARLKKVEQAYRDGNIVPVAMPYSTHTESFDMEDLVRGLGDASYVARKYGKPLPIAAKLTDVPCHSRFIPTLLANAGVKFLHIGCNYSSRYAHVPPLFWWEGPDGSRILCSYSRDYGTGLMPPKGWPSKHYLAMIVTHDNSGLPDANLAKHIRNAVSQGTNGLKFHIGSVDDFAKAILAENPDLPVIRGDMADTWIHGVMAMPVESAVARNIRPLEPALETLDTELGVWGVARAPLAGKLAKAYEQSGLYGEHTFGSWGPKGSSWDSGLPRREYYGDEWKKYRAEGRYKKYEDTFRVKGDFIRNAEKIVRTELDARLKALAGAVKAPEGSTVVYNPLPWPRSGVVTVDGAEFLASDVPPCGYKVVEPVMSIAVQPKLDGKVLDTAHFTVTFDTERGGIVSLVEKATGRELVDKTSPYALGQYIHERFDAKRMMQYFHDYVGSSLRPGGPAAVVHENTPKDLAYGVVTPGAWTLDARRTAAADIVTLSAGDTRGLAKGLTLEFSFRHDTPSMDVTWRIDGKTADPIPEGGWLSFPLAAENPRYSLGRLGAPTDPTKDIIRGTNVDYICINTGLSVSGDNGGATLCPLDSPCVSIGEPGLWKANWKFKPARPSVFVNLYNNMWATNFPYWIDGSWKSTVRLRPTAKSTPASDMPVSSWEARMPLLGARTTGTGSLPASRAGVAVSRPGTLVTAFGTDPDGNKGTLLRVWEQAGLSGDLTVTLPEGFTATSATPVNLRGEKIGEPLKVENGKISFPLKAYAPASFILN